MGLDQPLELGLGEKSGNLSEHTLQQMLFCTCFTVMQLELDISSNIVCLTKKCSEGFPVFYLKLFEGTGLYLVCVCVFVCEAVKFQVR